MRRRLSLILFLITALALTSVSISSADPGAATFTPGSVDFGSVHVGASADPITVHVTNASPDTAMDITDVTIGGPDQGAFGVQNGSDGCSGVTVQPGDHCDVTLTFSPNSAGSKTATMTVNESLGTDDLSLSGNATPAPQPAIGVSPNPYDFLGQKKGTTSAPQQFTITNSGDAGSTLHISNVTIATGSDPAFQISANGCNDSDAPCNVNVTFSPGATGTLTGGLSITPATGDPVVVPLQGTGTVPIASVPANVAFSTPVNTPIIKQVTLTNDGNANLDVKGVTLSGNGFSNPGTGNCGNAVLAPDASCQANIQFNPSSPGSYNGTLTFTDDDNSSPGSQQTVQLVGTVKVPGIQPSPTTVPFGVTVLGHITAGSTVTIQNTGEANLHIGNVRIGGLNPGAFVLGSENCTNGAIAPNDTCTATVRFAPSKASGRTGTLVFVNDAGSDQSIPLTGEGQRPPDGTRLRAAAGCTDASLSWQNPDAPMFKKEIIVRGRRHYPTSVHDGVIVKHSGPSAVDSGPRQFHTYRYTLFSRYGSYNGEKVFYSEGMHAKIHTGRICRPRSGGLIGDLTPTVDWTSYTGARYYAFILQRSGKTIWVHYVKRGSRFTIPQSWRYGGSTRGLSRGSTYSFYLYAYTRHRPNGVTIGQTTWSQR